MFLRTGSTASPERAAHAAAGIANSRLLRRVEHHVVGRASRVRRRRSGRSRRRAANGSSPSISAVLKPSGRAASAPIADHLGVLRQVRALRLQPRRARPRSPRAGRLPSREQDRRADRRAGQHRARRSPLPVVLVDQHDGGRAVAVARGGVERARHAGGVGDAASPPPTRVVLRVAVDGKPSFSAACSSSPFTPSCGGRGRVVTRAAADGQQGRSGKKQGGKTAQFAAAR